MSRYPRGYAISAASTPALHKWREVHAAKVAAGQSDRQMLDDIEAELAERGEPAETPDPTPGTDASNTWTDTDASTWPAQWDTSTRDIGPSGGVARQKKPRRRA